MKLFKFFVSLFLYLITLLPLVEGQGETYAQAPPAWNPNLTAGGANSMLFKFTKQVWLNPTIIIAKQNFEQAVNVKLLILPRLNSNDTTGSSRIEKAFDKLLSFLVYQENIQGSIKFYFDPHNPAKPFTFGTSDELHCKFSPLEKDTVEQLLNLNVANSSNLNNFTALPFESSITQASLYCKKILQSKPGACGPNPENEFTLTQINTSPAKLNFERTSYQQNIINGGVDKQKYAELAQHYNTVIDIADNSNYPMVWKAMAANSNGFIKLKLKKKQSSFDISKLVFKNAAGTETYNTTFKSSDSTISLSMSGKAPGSMAEVVAYYTPAATPPQTFAIGAFNVQFYQAKPLNVVLVSLDNAPIPTTNAVRDTLNKIYGNVFINWNVSTASCNLPPEISKSIHIESSGLLSNYMPDMQPIVSHFKDNCPAYIGTTENTYYLLFGCTNDGSLQGYMPRARNTGFIFDVSPHTIAHELGHGVFNLKHIFSSDELGEGNRYLTNNIMDYAANNASAGQISQQNALYKHQWDLIHDPSFVGWFEGDDEDAASYGDNAGIPKEFKQTNDSTYSFITPSKKIIKLPKETTFASLSYGTTDIPGNELFPSGVLKSFKIKENGIEIFYQCKIVNNQFYGYFKNNLTIPYANYLTPAGQTNSSPPVYIFDNNAIFGYPTDKGMEYFKLTGLNALSYYNGETQAIIDLLDLTGNSCNLGAQSWVSVKTYLYNKGQVVSGIDANQVNTSYTNLMVKIGATAADKNVQAILMTKVLELKSVYPDLLPMVSRFSTINDWGGSTNLFTSIINTFNNNNLPIDYFILQNQSGQSYTGGGYFEYQVDSANWESLSKGELLARFISSYLQVIERVKIANHSIIAEITNPLNCNLSLSDASNTIKNLAQVGIDMAVTAMSTEELKMICPNVRSQLIAMLLNGAVFNSTERSIYKLMWTCQAGAQRADFLVAIDKVQDVNEKYILQNLVKSVDDETVFMGQNYNTWIMGYFISAYSDLLKYHASSEAGVYYTDNIQPNLIGTLKTNNQFKQIRDRYYTYDYVNVVKRLFKQIVASSNGGTGAILVSSDYKSVVSYNENSGKLTYENKLVKGFAVESTPVTINNISAFEPMIIDVKGDLLGPYSNQLTTDGKPTSQYMPAIVLLFAEAKADAQTTKDAIQTGVDLVTLAIPGGQTTMFLKVLNYADKLSSVSSILGTSQQDDNTELAAALNITSSILGIANLASVGNVGDYVAKYKNINELNASAALINKTEAILSPANHELIVIEGCTKILNNDPDAVLALSRSSSAKLLENIVESEIEAAKDAGKYSGNLKTKLDNALTKIEAAVNSAGNLNFINGWTKQSIISKVQELKPLGQVLNPTTYIDATHIANHLNILKGKASYLVTGKAYEDFIQGKALIGRSDGNFISSVADIDAVLVKANGNVAIIEQELGIQTGNWQGIDKKGIYRIDITAPENLNLRMSNGAETAANPLWEPGGLTSGGKVEAVIDQLPAGSFQAFKVVSGTGGFIPGLLNKIDNVENALATIAKNEVEILEELVKTNNDVNVSENAKKFWAQHEMNVTSYLENTYGGSSKVGQQITVDFYIQGSANPTRCRIDNLIDIGSGKFRIADGKSSIINDLSTKTPEQLLNSMSTINQKIFYDALKNGTVTQIKPAGQRAIDYFSGLGNGILPTNINVEKSVDFFVNDVSTNGYNIFKKTLVQ